MVVGDAAARTAQGEGRADDGGKSHVFQDFTGLVEVVGDFTAHGLEADAVHGVAELLPVLRLVDGLAGGADHLHPVLFKNAQAIEVQGAVESGLPAHGREYGVRLLRLDDLLEGAPVDRLDVGGVGKVRVRHDGGRVGIHQDDPVALLLQRLAGLHPGIVELAGLADDDGPCADDQDRPDVLSPAHCASPRADAIIPMNRSNRLWMSRGPGLASGWPWNE